jgi:toxin-antitoxin system PIN domain toxin
MIAVDTNVLVHAHRRDSALHEAASNLMLSLATRGPSWAIPWPCLHEFYGVVTHPKVFAPASTVAQAWTQIHAWTSSPSVTLLSESRAHLPEIESLIVRAQSIGPAVHDARIAAICLSHGVAELITLDRDFSRFPQLRTRGILS